MKLDWEERDIAVCNHKNESGVEVLSARVKDGLAYHRSIDGPGRWVLTHLNTGSSIGYGDKAAQMRACGNALLDIGDWSFKTPNGAVKKGRDFGTKVRDVLVAHHIVRGSGISVKETPRSWKAARAHNTREIAA